VGRAAWGCAGNAAVEGSDGRQAKSSSTSSGASQKGDTKGEDAAPASTSTADERAFGGSQSEEKAPGELETGTQRSPSPMCQWTKVSPGTGRATPSVQPCDHSRTLLGSFAYYRCERLRASLYTWGGLAVS